MQMREGIFQGGRALDHGPRISVLYSILEHWADRTRDPKSYSQYDRLAYKEKNAPVMARCEVS